MAGVMLERAQPRRRTTQASRTERQRRYRQRQREGVMVVSVALDAQALDLLTRLGWAREGDDQAAIGAAIAAMLRDAIFRYA
jgi:hypothetical protein